MIYFCLKQDPKSTIILLLYMASPEMLRIPVGQTFEFGGSSIEVTSNLLSRNTNPSDTATHEATHAVVARAHGTGVKKASVIPGPGYLGITELSNFDAVAAIAPHAMGHDGTGWDVYITQAQGHGVDTAGSVARGYVHAEKEVITEVAAHLDNKGTLSGYEIDAIRNDVKQGESVTIRRVDENGREEVIKTRATDGIVMLPSRLYDPEQKAA